MLTKIKLVLVAGAVMVLPIMASAQASFEGKGLGQSLFEIVNFINAYIVPFLIAIAILYVIYGAFKFITAGGDEDKRKAGRDAIIYGLIGIFVMVSIVGLVSVLGRTARFGSTNITVPQIPLPTVR